jgi:transposase
VGLAASRLSAERDGLLLFQYLAQEWRLGTNEHRPARTSASGGRTSSDAQRGQSGQPIGENDGKRGIRGYDGGKQINGRKRHILVDTLGLLLKVLVTEGNRHDGEAGIRLLLMIMGLFPRLRLIWADGSYRGKFADWVQYLGQWVVEITLPNANGKGFQVLPRRWVVERTFSWFSLSRRLSKDYEYYPQTSEAMIYVVMIRLMLRRLAPS